MSGFSVSAVALDVPALRAALADPAHGGFCAFEGWVRNRNDGRDVRGLEYEVYTELAMAEGERILDEARARFGEVQVVGAHRSGVLEVGDLAVWVGVSSPHRDAAFRACRYVIDAFKHRLPVWKKEHYLEGEAQWVVCSHGVGPAADDLDAAAPHAHAHTHSHTHHPAPAAPAFTPDYARQMRLREVGEHGQARLAAARVLVIGAGGLGSPALTYLAGAGIGTLGIVDGDHLEASNLHRQTLYTAAEVGQPKAHLAAARLQALNPALQVEVFDTPLTAATVGAVFARFDLVLECTDDMRSRYLSNDAAQLAGIPLILASVHQYEGQLQVIAPGGPCLRCLWPEPPSAETFGSCAESGVLGTVPGVLGTLQANEALKQLLGLPVTAGALVLVDLLDNQTQRLPIDPARGCRLHGGCEAVAQRELAQAREELTVDYDAPSLHAAREAGFHLVDLRDAHERVAQPSGASAQWVPAPELLQRQAELPSGRPLLLFCATGRRSAAAARQLRAHGIATAYSLNGGLRGSATASIAAPHASPSPRFTACQPDPVHHPEPGPLPSAPSAPRVR